MAALTVQDIVEAGLNASYVAASGGGDTVVNRLGDVVLHVKNTDASAHSVTVTAQQTAKLVAGFGTLTKGNVQVSVPAGSDRFIGPFPPGAFNNAGGQIAVSYSLTTGMTVAALRVPAAG